MTMSRQFRWTRLLSAVLLVAGSASAEPNFSRTNGLKVGEGRLHPFLDVEMRYNSAAGFFPGPDSPLGELRPEWILHIRPGLKLEVNTPDVGINVSGNVDYLYYTGILTPDSTDASRVEAMADVDLAFNKQGAVEFQLGDRFTRSDRTNNPALGVGALSLFNEVRAAIPIHPGGRAIEVRPHGAFGVEFFEPISNIPVANCADITCQPNQVELMDYRNIKGGLDARWKFLPKTALVFESELNSRYYTHTGTNPPALVLRAMTGVAGLLTAKFSAVAKVGWGHDFEDSGASSLIGNLEGTFAPSEATSFRLGYLRTVDPVPTYGAYTDDRVYLNLKHVLARRVTFKASATFDYLAFSGLQRRYDYNLGGELGPDVQLLTWMSVGAGYAISKHWSNQLATVATANYTRHEAYLRLTLAY
jgi:hypothetical protein